MEQITIKIHLKHLKKPLMIILSEKSQIQKLVTMLIADPVIKFGELIFARDEFVYAEIEEK